MTFLRAALLLTHSHMDTDDLAVPDTRLSCLGVPNLEVTEAQRDRSNHALPSTSLESSQLKKEATETNPSPIF